MPQFVGAPLAEDPIDDRQQAPGRGDPRGVGALSLAQTLEVLAKVAIALDGGGGRLDERPAEPLVALLGQAPVKDLAAGGVHGRHEAGIGAELVGAAEAADVADLGDHEDGEEGAEAGDRADEGDGSVGELFGPHVRGGDEIAAQQMREDPRVDPVRLDPRFGNGGWT